MAEATTEASSRISDSSSNSSHGIYNSNDHLEQVDLWEQQRQVVSQRHDDHSNHNNINIITHSSSNISPPPIDRNEEGPILQQWTQCTSGMHNSISRAVVSLSRYSAMNPKTVVGAITLIAFVLVPVGFFTNFSMEVEQEAILAPFNSLSRRNYDWVETESGFPETTRPFELLIHQSGDNVLTVATMRRVFTALAVFRQTRGYRDICASGDYENVSGQKTCRIHAATRFWWHNMTLFDQHVKTDQDLALTLSADEYPLGTPVGDHDFILGNYETVEEEEAGDVTMGTSANSTTSSNHTATKILSSAQSYIIRIDLPVVDIHTSAFEDQVTQELLELRNAWAEESDNLVRLELFTFRSIPNEFTRAIMLDLPLYPAVFFIMCSFACLAFFRRDPVHSRCLLGIGSVCTIGLSLMVGMGTMFIIGVPLTNLTGSLAFVVFGVGLDDTFIIMGYYSRTDPRKDPLDRVTETMEVVGLSIFVTTMTTMTAFGLGTMSAVPAIRWLCLYALPTIFIDFLFQITFFVALLVLDERRIRANRRDCLFCVTAKRGKARPTGESADDDQEEEGTSSGEADERDESLDIAIPPKTYAERFMAYYADILLRPKVKVLVILCFTIFLGFAMYSATLLKQEFKAEEIVPEDSYVKGFLHGVNEYSAQVITVGAYFRDVDQSDSKMQEQMLGYISDMTDLEQMGEEPPFCWVRDFQEIRNQNSELSSGLENLTFSQQLDVALSIPAIKEVYGSDIVRDEDGNVTASRCWFFMKNLDMQNVQDQTNMLLDQRGVSLNHPVNQGRARLAFFSFDIWYIIWEFYTVAINELILTTIAGIVAVSIVGFLFIPHWSGVLFISPLITTLYIDLLGALQFAGVSINVVTYVCLVISVGLLVDFLMHILLKYYESHGITREEKVRDILESIGPSILVGGLSTFLGVVPLAFSTNEVNRIVFTSFIAMVTLGFGHGLIFLPVVLSIVGPTNFRPRTHHHKAVSKDLPNKEAGKTGEASPVTDSLPIDDREGGDTGDVPRLRKQTSDTTPLRRSRHDSDSDSEEAKVEEACELYVMEEGNEFQQPKA